jgi:hypothetical protein
LAIPIFSYQFIKIKRTAAHKKFERRRNGLTPTHARPIFMEHGEKS